MRALTTRKANNLVRSVQKWNIQEWLGHRPSIGGGVVFWQARSHMNHGGGGNPAMGTLPTMNDGPRLPHVSLGLEATKHSGNLLRLLESSHQYLDNMQLLSSTVWHLKRGQYWMFNDTTQTWAAHKPDQPLPTTATMKSSRSTTTTSPKLVSLAFSDECTALIKLVGADGRTRYLSLLKLANDDSMAKRESMGGPPFLANDGWMILREVVAVAADGDDGGKSSLQDIAEITKAIQTYWDIEHGGGIDDRNRAEELFHPQATLLSVGMAPIDSSDDNSEWTAPVGSLCEISLETYLEGVESQTPHAPESAQHDTVVTMDISGNTAAVTLTVGNGAQSTLFQDHLLLGRQQQQDASSSGWIILSKTFSPQAWPQG